MLLVKVCTLRGARSRNLYFFMINASNVETNKIHEKSFELVVCKFNVITFKFIYTRTKAKASPFTLVLNIFGTK